MIENGLREKNRTGVGCRLHSCGGVESVSVEIVSIHDHIAEVDPYPKLEMSRIRCAGLLRRERLLNIVGAGHGVGHGAELNKATIAHQLHDAPTMASDQGVEEFFTKRS